MKFLESQMAQGDID